VNSEAPYDILVIGDRAAGTGVAEALRKGGLRVARVDGPGPGEAEGNPTLTDLSGCFGAFEAGLLSEGNRRRSRVRGGIAVQSGRREADFEALGLEPGERVVTLSTFLEALPGLQPVEQGGRRPLALFLLGLGRESSPRATRETLAAVTPLLDDLGWRAAVLYGNLKVSGAGLEAAVREARRKGAVLLRFADGRPAFVQEAGGGVAVDCMDESSRTRLTLHPDWIVVDETLRPGPAEQALAERLGADPGPDGFMPSDNVYRFGLETNRRGILALPPGGDPLGRDAVEDDLAAAALEMRALERLVSRGPDRAAGIDTRLCARCLTCYRACPHGAVTLGERVEIVSSACFACGICEGACPARAIALLGPEGEPGRAEREPVLPHIGSGELVVFGCRRSAERARRLCEHLGGELPSDLLFVPVDCAGCISKQTIMDALLAGAAGVLVLTCHPGNCHAERGNLEARSRVEEVRRFLREAGMDPGRVGFHTLAANMGVELGRMVRGFKETLEES
jgi:coenzyme F420-reducing hydrogenase delta subunit/NAD-dependent dihydropyrimidine dehydrogenase PreA subunit